MTQGEHLKAIALLQARHAEMVQTLAALERADQTVELDQTLQGRLSRIDAMTQQQMAKAGHAHLALELRRAEAALARVVAGRYGECCGCHEAIDVQRLQADPAAPFCMECLAEMAEERARDERLDRR